MISIVVGVVVIALLLAWANYEIDSLLSGDKARTQFERAEDRFGDRWGVLDMHHDEFGNTTMELAPLTPVAKRYDSLARDTTSYFERRDRGKVTLQVDQAELTLEDDDDVARRLGLRLVDQLRSLDGPQLISISAGADHLAVQVDGDRTPNVLPLYREVQEACAVAAPGADVAISVAGPASGPDTPYGYISDELDYDYSAAKDQDRSADLSRELAVYRHYDRRYEVVRVFISPSHVKLTVAKDAAQARSDALREYRFSSIEVEIDPEEEE